MQRAVRWLRQTGNGFTGAAQRGMRECQHVYLLWGRWRVEDGGT